MQWVKNGLDYRLVKSTAKRWQMPTMLAAVLHRRMISDSAEELKYFINRSIYGQHSPFLLPDVVPAIRRILKAKKLKQKILIFGDRDADGITATVTLLEGLRLEGLDCDWQVPCADDPYGLSMAAVERCADSGISLIITVDCGISNHNEIAAARAQGIDTIVIDHHNPAATLPPAVAVINPKRQDCAYPCPSLSGCALAYKFILAMQYYRSRLYGKRLVIFHIDTHRGATCLYVYAATNLGELRATRHAMRPLWQRLLPLSAVTSGRRYALYAALSASNPSLATDVLLRHAVVIPFARDSQSASDTPNPDASNPDASNPDTPNPDIPDIEDIHRAHYRYIVSKNRAYDYAFNELAPLAALSTIADMVPLMNENRIIVDHGIRNMPLAINEGLRALFRKKELPLANLTARILAFNIIPLLNAAGRLGHADLAVRLLLTKDIRDAERAADRLVAIHKDQKNIMRNVQQQYHGQAADSYRTLDRRGVIIAGQTIPAGVTGLLANALLNEFHTMAVVISCGEDKVNGSMRCDHSRKATEIIGRFSELLSNWGGHDRAAGFTVLDGEYDRFLVALTRHLQRDGARNGAAQTIEIDAEIPRSLLNNSLFETNSMLEPFGQAFPPIVYYTKEMVISNVKILGKEERHAKLLLDTGAAKVPAAFWNCARYFGTVLKANNTIDIIYNLEYNYFRHNMERRLSIIDAALHGQEVRA